MQEQKSMQQTILELVNRIPFGKVCFYFQIEEILGNTTYHLVKQILNAYEYTDIPVHRVIRTTKFIGPLESEKCRKLINEGIIIDNNGYAVIGQDKIFSFDRTLQ